MLQLYRTQRINGSFWVIALLLLLQTNQWLVSVLVNHNSFSLLGWQNSYLAILVSTLVIYFSASLINNVCNRFQLFSSGSYLPAAVSCLLFALYDKIFTVSAWMLVVIIMVLIINKLFKTYQKNKPEPNYFDVFFLFSVITILFPPLIFLTPALVIAVFIFSIPKWQYFLIALIGFLMPWLFWCTYLFITDELSWVVSQYNFLLDGQTNFRGLHFSDVLPASILYCFYTIIATMYWVGNSHRLQQIQRPVLLFVTMFILFGIIAVALFLTWQWVYLLALIFPLAILSSYYFFEGGKILATILFLLLAGCAFVLPWIQ